MAANPQGALAALQDRARRLLQKGLDRSAIFADLTKANQLHRLNVPDEDILHLLKKLPEKSQDVNQESQETLKNQEMQAKRKEGQGEGARAGGAPTVSQKPRTTAEVFREELESGLPSSLTFEAYLTHAIEEHHRAAGERDGWQSDLFYFIRLLKGHPDMAKAAAQKALQRVQKQLLAWTRAHPQQGVTDPWERWLGVSQEDAHAEFLDAWDKVRYLPGYSPLDNAVEQARRTPLRLHKELKERRTDGYQHFISIAGWLRVGMGDANSLLPVEELAPLLRVKPMTVSRYRHWAVEDGFLKEGKPYQRRSENRAGKATEFRFNVERFPILGERAEDGTQDSCDEAGQ